MPYPDRVVYNGSAVSYIPVDNTWILANKQRHLAISAVPLSIQADPTGAIVSTVTLQLQTPLLVDDTRDNVALARVVKMSIAQGNDQRFADLTLDANGAAVVDVFGYLPGQIVIKYEGLDLSFDTTTIEVTS